MPGSKIERWSWSPNYGGQIRLGTEPRWTVYVKAREAVFSSRVTLTLRYPILGGSIGYETVSGTAPAPAASDGTTPTPAMPTFLTNGRAGTAAYDILAEPNLAGASYDAVYNRSVVVFS